MNISFHLSANREREKRADQERRRREYEREELKDEQDAKRWRVRRIRVIEKNRRRLLVPDPPAPLRQRPYLRPVIDQSEALQGMIEELRLDNRPGETAIIEVAAERRRLERRLDKIDRIIGGD